MKFQSVAICKKYSCFCSKNLKYLVSTKFVALAQSKTSYEGDAGIKYYGEVKNIKIIKRRDIIEITKDSDEEYYMIEVNEWKELERKIEVSGYQVIRILYTTEFLLKNAAIVTELCIKSKEEYRLWQDNSNDKIIVVGQLVVLHHRLRWDGSCGNLVLPIQQHNTELIKNTFICRFKAKYF